MRHDVKKAHELRNLKRRTILKTEETKIGSQLGTEVKPYILSQESLQIRLQEFEKYEDSLKSIRSK